MALMLAGGVTNVLVIRTCMLRYKVCSRLRDLAPLS